VLRDLGFYLRRLVTHDAAQGTLFVAATLQLLANIIYSGVRHKAYTVAPIWSLFVFTVVVVWSGFRLWRDEREISEREGTLFRVVADSLRGQIDPQDAQRFRNFVYAENPDDREHHQRAFLKHFPNTAKVIDEWLNNPAEQDTALIILQGLVQGQIPEGIPSDMAPSLALVIRSYVERTRLFSSPPAGWFEARTGTWGPTGEEITCLAVNEGPSSGSIYTNIRDLEGVDQIAVTLNALSIQAWDLPQARAYRELAKKDRRLRDELRHFLGEIVNKPHLTRRHCDRECYELSSGD
jgi:hypothetical protein